ncbi:sensor histidine kinase [Cesiribacter andamanensis]|uniref:histidine kinase n=1 Tax=Cesiribacter andamanensis AMV16 TaxID=1279009 RepID=M7NTZ3_9BACT|nr:HAMP domain-containing sensor histidine kinase [Cesiribacter andamanensis]EMR01954.1 Autoinducer 2 sensor kinase/phosphatase luxQ [Cesiribacter andamanensis AMV16]
MKKYNPLLEKQLKKWGPSLEPLLDHISTTYDQFEQDKVAVEAAMIRKAEELLASNEELRKANAELDRFVYSVSHDLRAPIASVLGLIDIAKKEADAGQRQRYMELMQESLLRLDSFIHDIIDYSRNNRLESLPEAIDFEALIEEVASSLRYIPEAYTIDLIKEIALEAPFYTDKSRLKVILTNLVSNAVRYHSPRRHNPYIRLHITANARQAEIVVEDNGIGIEEQYLPRIFDMFFRAHSQSKGSGLGLYIVKETAKKLEGEISVSSVFGEGTTFTLLLPNLLPPNPVLPLAAVRPFN